MLLTVLLVPLQIPLTILAICIDPLVILNTTTSTVEPLLLTVNLALNMAIIICPM